MIIGKNDILKFLSDPFDIKVLEAAFRNLDDTSNPIRFNNFAYVLRELVNRVIDRLAPNKEVIAAKWWKPSPDDKIANKANRRQQIRYALLDGNPEDFVIQKLEIDVDEIADYVYECIGRLNKFTHISSAYFGCPEKEIPLRVSEACSTITNMFGTIWQCRDKIAEGIMDLIDEELVESIVVERMIDEARHGLRMTLISQACGREPLPVAVMSEDGGTVLSLVKTLLQLVHTPEFNMS